MEILMLLYLVGPSVLVAPAHGATTVVNPTVNPLQDALHAAEDGDTLILDPGTYAPVVVSGGKTLTIEGGPLGEAILSGMWITGGEVALRGLVFADSTQGLKIEAGTATVEGSTFRDVGGTFAPAIAVQAGAGLTLSDSVLERVRGPQGAISVTTDSVLSIDDVDIRDCRGDEGGAIFADASTVSLERVLIEGCEGQTGGGIAAMSGTVVMQSVRITDTIADSGGGLYVGSGAAVSAEDVVMSGNVANNGGHITIDGGSLLWDRGALLHASAETGGGISITSGTASIHNALWSRLTASSGGGLSATGGQVSIRHSVIANTEAVAGAAIAAAGGAVSISASIIVSSAGAEAIANTNPAPMSLTDVLLWDNAEGEWIGAVDAAGLIVDDPLFTDTIGGDWTLRSGSPGLDAAAGLDHDGTAADVGIFGGSRAVELPDDDGDGYVYGRDCDDSNGMVNESMSEIWYDGVDSNCDGVSDFDADGDGWDSESRAGGGDCDDFSAQIFPGQQEFADGIDGNCDGVDLVDADGDGFGYDADCDDFDASVYPGAEDEWYNDRDEDCAGNHDFDADGDGFLAEEYDGPMGGPVDCDDADPFVNPGMPEIISDGIDNDCRNGDLAPPEDENGAISELEGETEGDNAVVFIEDDYERPDHLMATAGCSSVGSKPGWAIAGMAFMMSLRRRRKSV
jgi:hypothetical protein